MTTTAAPPSPRAAAVVRDGNDDDRLGHHAVDQGVRVIVQNKPSCSVARFDAHVGIFEQALRGLHGSEVKVTCNVEPGLIAVILQRLYKFDLGLALPSKPQLPDFLSISSISAMTCSCGINSTVPASISATRRAISSSQAWAMASGLSSAGPSRLTIRRWRVCRALAAKAARPGFQSLSITLP